MHQTLELKQGVPQGSKLGPLLFIVYVNDIINIEVQLVMYADDTNVFYSCDNLIKLHSMVNVYLEQLSNWSLDTKLQLNAKKATYMIFIAVQ